MKIYTKTGDAGETSLLGGKRVGKSCVEMEVIGELDELDAALGIVLSLKPEKSLAVFLQTIQRDLFKIGAELASLQMPDKGKFIQIGENKITELEKEIDKMSAELPGLKNFILPGGSPVGAHLHLARTVCRRAERRLVEFGKKEKIRPELYQYLNRLSDFLFTAARRVNFYDKIEEQEVN